MNRLWGAIAGVVATVALALACCGLVSVPDAASLPSGGGHVVVADGNGGGGSVTDTGWGGGS